jgi:hypothetical protein
VSHGRDLGPDDVSVPGDEMPAYAALRRGTPSPAEPAWIRLMDETGALVALATAGKAPGSLHPAVVLI